MPTNNNFDLNDPIFQRKLKKTIKKLEQLSDKDLPEAIAKYWKKIAPNASNSFAAKNARIWGVIWNSGINKSYEDGIKKTSYSTFVSSPGVIREAADDYFEEHGMDLVKTLTESDLLKLKGQMVANWGKGEDAFAKEYKDSYSVSPERIKTIYRTEHHRAMNHGVLAVSKKLGREYKQWIVPNDERTCPICKSHIDDIVPIDEPFRGVDKDGNILEYNIPQDSHPNCVVPGTECVIPGKLLGAARSWYKGEVIKINFKSGRSLTVTPNHMILTDIGFAAAKLLREGDNVLSCTNFKGIITTINKDNNNYIPTIDEIFGSLFMNGKFLTREMPSSSEYFHGDGQFINGNINIVDANCFLLNNGESIVFKKFLEDDLSSGNITQAAFDTFGMITELFKCLSTASDCGMSTVRKSAPFFLRRLRHAQEHGLAPVSGNDAILCENPGNNIPTTFENFGECFDRIASTKKFNNPCIINNSEFSISNSESLKSSVNGHLGTSKFIDHILSAHSRIITTDKIVSINVFPYHGYVYDAQSINSLLICNGIIVSNCRCTVITLREKDLTEEQKDQLIVKGYREDEPEPIDTNGEQWTPQVESDEEYVETDEVKENSIVQKLNYKCKTGTKNPGTNECLTTKTGGSIAKVIHDDILVKIQKKWESNPDRAYDGIMQNSLEDSRLHDIAEVQGFTGKPKLLTEKELENYAKENGVPVMYRGVSDMKHAEEFKKGSYWAGKGLTGNGTYCAYGNRGKEVASKYSEGGVIMKLALQKDAKIINYFEIPKLQGQLSRKSAMKYSNIFQDEGRIAAMLGYDAINLPPDGDPNDEGLWANMIVLNRSKLMVVK